MRDVFTSMFVPMMSVPPSPVVGYRSATHRACMKGSTEPKKCFDTAACPSIPTSWSSERADFRSVLSPRTADNPPMQALEAFRSQRDTICGESDTETGDIPLNVQDLVLSVTNHAGLVW